MDDHCQSGRISTAFFWDKTKNAIGAVSEKKLFFQQRSKNTSIRKVHGFLFSPVAQNLTTFYHPKTTNTAINYLEKVCRLY
ncbi:hypothetical protein ATZ33_08930 [Enterococcus silesiacus]|uniref:Uncharacterized protein n=1 Tax=Enterococcus silesiacus TaxID=332949 RepID=A0A0S3KB63_9ENTE|nr:hypothetical protein [Enterococcus silesiacus]ALS01486.1 hypothetical protein ATZ33_08930 [Enterococcus silesiacus]OJG91913.1 hypothetical protein RV15_GL003558 [Enterococcus silesiacus]